MSRDCYPLLYDVTTDAQVARTQNTDSVLWRHRLCRNVYTEPFSRNGSHNPRCSIDVNVYYLATAVPVTQQFLHGVNTPQYVFSMDVQT
jgi:hypothetical protein